MSKFFKAGFSSLFQISFKYLFIFFVLITLSQSVVLGQLKSKDEKKVTGLDISILPTFHYSSDNGFRFGALSNIFYYTDSIKYPDFLFNLYLQSSFSTKRNFELGFLKIVKN